jgi:mRNA interferase MazF
MRTEASLASFLGRGAAVTIADRHTEFPGKPRSAVVVQSPHFTITTLTVCLITSGAVDAPLARIPLPVDAARGLTQSSWVQIDQLTTIRRVRVGSLTGHLEAATELTIGRALAGTFSARLRRSSTCGRILRHPPAATRPLTPANRCARSSRSSLACRSPRPRRMEMSPQTRSGVLGGRRIQITGIALRSEQLVDGNTEFYLDMQTALDMWRTRQRLKDQLSKI